MKSKSSKVETLRGAIEYIKELRRVLGEDIEDFKNSTFEFKMESGDDDGEFKLFSSLYQNENTGIISTTKHSVGQNWSYNGQDRFSNIDQKRNLKRWDDPLIRCLCQCRPFKSAQCLLSYSRINLPTNVGSQNYSIHPPPPYSRRKLNAWGVGLNLFQVQYLEHVLPSTLLRMNHIIKKTMKLETCWLLVSFERRKNTWNHVLFHIPFFADDNSNFSELTTEQSPENSSPETSLRELSALHPMVYQLPVSSPYRPTSLLTPTTCSLLVSPDAGSLTHLVVSTALEPSPKQLDSPPTNANGPLEKLPSISTTMWWPLPQPKWLSPWSSLWRWSWLRSSLWDDHNQTDLSGSSFVDTVQRLPPSP